MKHTNPLILLNRESSLPAGMVWRQIEVNGEHETQVEYSDGTVETLTQVIDSTARAKILADFETVKNREGFDGVLVDRDHLSHDKKNDTGAMAWLHDLKEGEDGCLYGLLDITGSGRKAVENRDYKYTSTEYDPDSLEWLGDGRFRPTQLVGLAFTNRPNNKGGRSLSAPITNRAPAASGASNQPTQKNTMQTIAEKLGLEADATEEDILAAIEALQTENKDAKSKEEEMEVEDILNRNAKRIPEGARDEFKALLIANREHGEKVLAKLPEKAEEKPEEKQGRETITNRAGAKQPSAARATGSDEEADKKRAASIHNRAKEIEKTQGIPFNAAFAKAQGEV